MAQGLNRSQLSAVQATQGAVLVLAGAAAAAAGAPGKQK